MFGLGLGRLGLGRALAAWTPAKLWPLGAASPGLWIDPPYTASMFADSTGTTAISAIGTVLDTSNPVGLVLDRKGGLELGPDRCSDPDFNTPASWGVDAGVTVSGGVCTFVSVASTQGVQDASPLTITSGKTYKVVFIIDSLTAGVIRPYLGGTYGNSYTTPGEKTEYLVAGVNGLLLLIAIGVTTCVISSLSVKEIPGIHLSQATATSRPVASARKNLLVGTDTLATQSVTVLASQCVLSFTGTGTVTLSGTSTAGPLAGTGAADRVSLTFTPTAGSLTLTVSGSVTLAQLEYRA